MINNTWERTALTLAAYVKAHYPFRNGEGPVDLITYGPTDRRPNTQRQRLTTIRRRRKDP